ncbi:hypothetical protein [Trujillonella humicola]|uniref:hypothetical protein n=1 Tax=Trujillonella humicola TaxID=3383699 RepID=UPI0039066CFC
MTARPPLPTLLGAGLLLVAGCSTAVPGVATHERPPAVSAGPLTEELGDLDLVEAVGNPGARLFDLAAQPDGSTLALLGDPDGYGRTGWLVRLVPGPGGLQVEEVTELPGFVEYSQVLTAGDGTVVVVGVAPGAEGYGLTVAAVHDGEVVEHLVDAGVDGTPDTTAAALSPDGTTVYVAGYWREDGEGSRLLAVDVGSGEVEESAPLGLETPGEAVLYDLAVGPDGDLLALAALDRDADGEESGAVLARYDRDLEPAAEPVELVADEPDSVTGALHVRPDGTVLATVTAGHYVTGDPRLVVVRGGEVVESIELEDTSDAPHHLAADPDGRYAYLPYNTTTYEPTLVTLDLTTGEVVASVPLCGDGGGGVGFVVLAADARTVTTGSACFVRVGATSTVSLIG